MRRTRRVWWQAAGLLLAATAGPALAQSSPGGVAPANDVPAGAPAPAADVLADVEPLPAPRPAVTPAAPAPHLVPQGTVVTPAPGPVGQTCAAGCAGGDGHWFGHLWGREKHAGCQAQMWGYPQEFEAPPLGATIHAHFRTMVSNGEAAAMVLYHYDFLEGSATLNLRGRDQLTKIAHMLVRNNFPILIERTPEAPAVAEARKAVILNILAHNDLAIPPERVVIGPPIAAGLSGIEASLLQQYFYDNLRVQGAPLPIRGAGIGLGAAGAAGFGAGVGR